MSTNVKIVTQGKKAIKALQKYEKERKTEKTALFPDQANAIVIQVKYKKVPLQRSTVQRRFVELPHSDKDPSNTTICLIMPDFDTSDKAKKDPDVDAQARQWADTLREKHDLDGSDVAKIYTYNQLQREHSTVLEKAKLANTYDIFLVDSMLQKKVFSFLGSSFVRHGKLPLPIHAHGNKLDEEISRAYNLESLSLRNLKDSVAVRIGNLNQKTSHLVENLKSIVDMMCAHCPGGEKNFRSCYIQCVGLNASLPIYVDLGSANDVPLEKSRKRVYAEVFDECSTLPDGLAVKVRMDGRVTVVDEKTRKTVDFNEFQLEITPKTESKTESKSETKTH